MLKRIELPRRARQKPADCWDLSSLYVDDDAWEAAFEPWRAAKDGYQRFRGKLHDSAAVLAECLRFDCDLERRSERLGGYASLKTAEDAGNSLYQRMLGRFRHAAAEASEAASFVRPEILAIEPARMDELLASPELAEFRLLLERMVRYRPHTLSPAEEKLLAMQAQMADATRQTFRQLHDVDLKWPLLKNERGELVELSNASFSGFLQSPLRGVRKAAFHKYYQQFAAHRHTLCATLAGSVERDVYYARARGYPSSLAAALFPDRVPGSVYDNLIAAVGAHLPALFRYYELRRRTMKLRQIHHYDTYVPILAERGKRHTWAQAVKLVVESLSPLGSEYCRVLERGLEGRWCDRYPNQGKQSGAFSSGSYDGDPYILMNYRSDVFDHVFTLAHEAGHSMHSHLSAASQPFQYYDYTIFVAEVASTFNEQLLSRHLLDRARSKAERAYLVNHEVDSIRATIFRQTMFAEFEKRTHELVEGGEPLTVDRVAGEYRQLLEKYFGPDFALDDELSLECLRIPHFYRAFYVYKYATGLAAAMALSQRVLGGGRPELEDYLGFLRGGCSQYPLDLLRGAGVDLQRREPIDAALARFDELIEELDRLL